jgi:hypothetical protein
VARVKEREKQGNGKSADEGWKRVEEGWNREGGKIELPCREVEKMPEYLNVFYWY